MRMRAYEQRRPHRNHRDQGLGRPEDGLFIKGLIGVSSEKPTPNAAGIQYSRREQAAEPFDDPFGN